MEYPKMIYLGGELGAEHRIVADEAEEKAAEADGFVAHDKPKKPAKPKAQP